MGRMHGDAQFAGSSSVPAHVEMMGLIGMGNNPMVGATVAVAVAIEESDVYKRQSFRVMLPSAVKVILNSTSPGISGFWFMGVTVMLNRKEPDTVMGTSADCSDLVLPPAGNSATK